MQFVMCFAIHCYVLLLMSWHLFGAAFVFVFVFECVWECEFVSDRGWLHAITTAIAPADCIVDNNKNSVGQIE